MTNIVDLSQYTGPAREVLHLVADELWIAQDNGQVEDEPGFAADVVTRLVRSYPTIATSALATIHDQEA